MQWPARQIAENAGLDGAVVVGKLLESHDANWGFDAQANEYGDLVARGVIDPAKVVRTALQDAASVAGLLITTEAMVAEKPKKETPMPAGGPGGMGGMGDMDCRSIKGSGRPRGSRGGGRPLSLSAPPARGARAPSRPGRRDAP